MPVSKLINKGLIELSGEEQDLVPCLVKNALARAVGLAEPEQINTLPAILKQAHGVFVTLYLQQQLRGCIGCIESSQPLYKEIPYYAQQSALHDPRFVAVNEHELAQIQFSVSILSSAMAINVSSLAALSKQLRPNVDGLILQEGRNRAVFLPSVWEQLPKPEDFINALLRKGGWPDYYWSKQMQASLFNVTCVDS